MLMDPNMDGKQIEDTLSNEIQTQIFNYVHQ